MRGSGGTARAAPRVGAAECWFGLERAVMRGVRGIGGQPRLRVAWGGGVAERVGGAGPVRAVVATAGGAGRYVSRGGRCVGVGGTSGERVQGALHVVVGVMFADGGKVCGIGAAGVVCKGFVDIRGVFTGGKGCIDVHGLNRLPPQHGLDDAVGLPTRQELWQARVTLS